MGREKAHKPRRESKVQRIEKRLAWETLRATGLQDQREAFIKAFGDVMTETEKTKYLLTGIFEGGEVPASAIREAVKVSGN